MIGKTIHLSWARSGARWELVSISGDTMLLKAKKSGKKLTQWVGYACYTRKHEPKKEAINEPGNA